MPSEAHRGVISVLACSTPASQLLILHRGGSRQARRVDRLAVSRANLPSRLFQPPHVNSLPFRQSFSLRLTCHVCHSARCWFDHLWTSGGCATWVAFEAAPAPFLVELPRNHLLII